VKKDELLMLSSEEYSDQCHAGPFKVLIDFNISEIAEIVKEQLSKHKWKNKTGPDDVIDYLKDGGFIVEIPCKQIHLGSYGDIDLSGDLE
jgi:hypothetical protein